MRSVLKVPFKGVYREASGKMGTIQSPDGASSESSGGWEWRGRSEERIGRTQWTESNVVVKDLQ